MTAAVRGTPAAGPRPAVFFDRDDTLIFCTGVAPGGDLGDPALVRLIPGAFEACAALKSAGFALAVVTNQGGVARGRFGLAEVERTNARVNELLSGMIDEFRFCPFHPGGRVPEFTREHPWRKPAPGMILDAARVLGVDLARSWMVGDADRDVASGDAAGCRTIQVRDARVFPSDREAPSGRATRVAPDLASAVRIILDGSAPEPDS